MSKNDKDPLPSISINNLPLATEEPVRRSWLKSELKDMNEDSEAEENLVDETTEAEGVSSSDSDDGSLNGQNKIKHILQDPEELAIEAEHQKEDFHHNYDMMSCLSNEMQEYQERQDDEYDQYERQVASAETEDDLLGATDPELLERTESNRYIPYNEEKTRPKRSNTIHAQDDDVHKNLLVFSDNPTIIEHPTKLVVVQYYGAGKTGIMPVVYRSKRKTKAYLVACDFSKESLYAIEWTMGTMMRDGDELHVSTVINREDNPDLVKASGLDQAGELRAASDLLNVEVKKLLGQMMLFNITLVTHAMVGRIKDCLKSLTSEVDFSLVVCGSRGRSSVKKLLMGSVSTYLVHKSPVPVAVIRRQKKKKRSKNDALEAHSLSEGIKTGQLHVDELG